MASELGHRNATDPTRSHQPIRRIRRTRPDCRARDETLRCQRIENRSRWVKPACQCADTLTIQAKGAGGVGRCLGGTDQLVRSKRLKLARASLAEGEIVLADQTVCLGCGTTNHGTKFCPECGAPAVPAPSEEPTLTQPVSGAASNATADDQPGDDTNPGAERAAQPLRRVSAIAPTTATTGLSN